MASDSELSEREREILRLVATGASNKQIAQQLVISTNTVKVHLRNIFSKIDVTSRTEATLYAIREGLVASPGGQAVVFNGSGAMAESVPAVPDTPPSTRRMATVIFPAIILVVLIAILGISLGRNLFSQATPAATQPPVPARWQEQAALPTGRSSLAAAVYGSAIYAIGGESANGITGETDQFLPASNQWVSLPDKPTPVADISAAVVGGKVYVPGGKLASGEPTGILEIFDPAQNRWEIGPNMPIQAYGYGLASLEGKLYLFGGWDGKQALSSVYEFNPDIGQWKQKTDMPTARAYFGTVVQGSLIYLIGGFNGHSALASNEAYSPGADGNGGSSTNSWKQLPPLPEGRYAMGATSVADTIYIIGGKNDPGGESTQTPAVGNIKSYQFLPISNLWVAFDMPQNPVGSNLSLVPYSKWIYILGGQNDRGISDQNLMYQAVYTVAIPGLMK